MHCLNFQGQKCMLDTIQEVVLEQLLTVLLVEGSGGGNQAYELGVDFSPEMVPGLKSWWCYRINDNGAASC